MQKIDVLTIEEGMPINVECADGESIRMFIHEYEDSYEDKGMDDDGTPKRIIGHQYSNSDEKTIVWDIKVDNSKVTKQKVIEKNGDTVEDIEVTKHLVNIETI